jgi:hypothetical protein
LNCLPSSSLELLLANYTNRLFAVSGRFPNPDAENAVFLGPRVREGEMGYHIVQPLQRNVGGDQVLVDRGFVPVGKIVNYKGDRSTWRLMDVSSILPIRQIIVLIDDAAECIR